MTDQSGLFGKYVVFKADTEQMVTDFCFVLKPETDPIAWDTLQFYAEHTADRDLSDDLLEWLGAHPKPGNYCCEPGCTNVATWVLAIEDDEPRHLCEKHIGPHVCASRRPYTHRKL